MIWTIAYWTLLFLAITTAIYALFWDRPGFRGRPKLRCKKCWYDLTDSPGDLRIEPIQCSECGKKHPSRRAMGKTRRSKKWISVSLVFVMGSYTAAVWPRVSRFNYSNGILGAVPTPALILAIPLLPDEPGTMIDRNTQAAVIPYPQRPMFERIAHQLKIRLYESKDTSQFDHWLFMQVSKRQSPASLMEKSSIRGDLFIYVFEAWERQYRLTDADTRWASRVYELKILHTEYGLEQWFSYANVRVRKLLKTPDWRVQINRTLYEPKMLGRWQEWDGFYDLRPVGSQYERWDYNQRIFDQLFINNGFWGGTPPTTFDRTIKGRIYQGDKDVDIWWPVANINETVQFKISKIKKAGPDTPPPNNRLVTEIDGFKIASDQQIALDWLSKNIRVNISHIDRMAQFYQQTPLSFPDFFQFWVDPDKLKRARLPAFTFGGEIKVVLEVVPGGRYDGPMPSRRIEVMEGDAAWWALRDEMDKDGARIFEGKGERVSLHLQDGPHYLTINKNDSVANAYIEIRFGSSVLGEDGYRALADLGATRFITRTVQIPIRPSEYSSILRVIQARSNTLDIGYKDLYEEGEIDELLEKHHTSNYSYHRRDKDWTGFVTGGSAS